MTVTAVQQCVRCTHLRGAHQTQGCRFNGCSCEAFDDGQPAVDENHKRFPAVPVLGFTRPLDDDSSDIPRLIVGMDSLTLDGKPFPWSTVGKWTLTFENDNVATLNLSIVVSIPRDPEADDGQ